MSEIKNMGRSEPRIHYQRSHIVIEGGSPELITLEHELRRELKKLGCGEIKYDQEARAYAKGKCQRRSEPVMLHKWIGVCQKPMPELYINPPPLEEVRKKVGRDRFVTSSVAEIARLYDQLKEASERRNQTQYEELVRKISNTVLLIAENGSQRREFGSELLRQVDTAGLIVIFRGTDAIRQAVEEVLLDFVNVEPDSVLSGKQVGYNFGTGLTRENPTHNRPTIYTFGSSPEVYNSLLRDLN